MSAILAAAFSIGTATASEVRFGIWEHDAEMFGLGGAKGKETGEAVSLEIIGDSPDWLEWARSPRPYIGGSLNLNGNTSHGGVGLLWRGDITKKIYVDYGFGLAIHDGTLEVPSPNTATTPAEIAERVGRKLNEIEFGSRVLFRNQFAFGFRVSDDWSTEIVWEHLSNGKILDDVNEGIDNVGIRVAKRF